MREEMDELEARGRPTSASHELGDVLFAAVNVARKLERRPRARAARGGRPVPGRASSADASWPHPTAEAGTISPLMSSSRTTPERA